MATTTRRVLYQKGDRGPEIVLLQQYLTRAGYDTKGVDGIFGSNTESAVRAIQASTGLPVDGLVWLETFEAIANAPQKRPTPVASSVAPKPEESVAKVEEPASSPLLPSGVPPWLIPAGIGAVALGALVFLSNRNSAPAMAGYRRKKRSK